MGGFFGDRWGASRARLAIAAAHVPTLAAFSLLVCVPWMTLPLMMVWAVASWSSGPRQQTALYSAAPESAGISLSLNSSFMQFGFAAGAAVGGLVVQVGSLGMLVWTGVGILLIAGTLAWMLAKMTHAATPTTWREEKRIAAKE